MHPEWLKPDWPAPARVRAFMTTRAGGVSLAPWDSMNPALHVDDDPGAVAQNRSILGQDLPCEPLWLNQVHGVGVAECGIVASGETADAGLARGPGEVCVVLTADCLPVLFCDRDGTVVAAAHAGWRGLAAGVLEATVLAMNVPPGEILAWLGAAIGPDAFEVGDEVRLAFMEQNPLAGVAFRPAGPTTFDAAPRKWLADIYTLARIRLASVGVGAVHGGGLCTYTDQRRFYSYRRAARTGRMASLIWLE
jgi:YfiH family protein